MSLKSRKRDRNKREENILFGQKQSILSAKLDCLGAAILFFVFAIGVLIVGYSKSAFFAGIIITEILIFCILVYFIFLYIQRLLLFKKFNLIASEGEEAVSVCCSKISFLYQPISRFSTKVLCVVFRDENGRKLYYVYPKKHMPYDFVKKNVIERYLKNKVEFICYKNTNIVKSLPL